MPAVPDLYADLPDPVLIHFERSGGFAGLRLQFDLSTASLPEQVAGEIREILSACAFFDLPPQLPSAPGADRFSYHIRVEVELHRHAVVFGDSAAPPELLRLADLLYQAARQAGSRPHSPTGPSGPSG